MKYEKFFPYKKAREQQKEAIEFCLDNFINQKKKFVVLELGTGCGKSAIGITVAKYLDSIKDLEEAGKSYILTTQKILQKQYMKDFGPPKNDLVNISSSTNYRCKFHSNNTCAESRQMLTGTDKSSPFWKACFNGCRYKRAKNEFIDRDLGVTNFSYFLAETKYSGALEQRKTLIIDEAHNIENELSKFIEVSFSEKFSKDILKVIWPVTKSQKGIIRWINDVYFSKLKEHYEHMKKNIEALKKSKVNIEEFKSLYRQYDMLSKHYHKVSKFIEIYDEDNWVMNLQEAFGKAMRKIEFKPINVGKFSHDLLFNYGNHVVLMSATIVDKDVFCESVGIPQDDVAFLSIDSPFPVKNKPVMYLPVGSMSIKEIDKTLPNMSIIIKDIIKNHKDEKGIIHTHTFKIAKYLKESIKSSRLILHDSSNRDVMVEKHFNSKKPTILLSPSLSEGIDLKDNLGKFQIICKMPYPFLGDKLVKKRMAANKTWYPYQTAKTIIQSVGRCIRHENDSAVTYILDENWGYFFYKNKELFPLSFIQSVQK